MLRIMREETAYSLMKGAGMSPDKAAAISKIFAVSDDTPQTREHLIAKMRDAGVSFDQANLLFHLFLDRWKSDEKSH